VRQPALLAGALLLGVAPLTGAAAPAGVEQKPLWELGLGVGTLLFNDYRGAATTHAYPVPVPYFVYRGRFLKADRNGLRGELLEENRIELNLSVNGTAPVRNDSARSGMPDLRPTLEIGPQLEVHLWRSNDERLKLDLRLPLRAALTIQAHPHMIGMFLAPNVNLDLAQFRGSEGWKLGLLAGPLFAQRRYDEYFYGVAPPYATAARPAYAAPGGYAGAELLAALTRRYASCWVGAYLRHDTLGGASFAASPLVKRNSYWSAGFGVAWLIRQSSRRVESED
jgi:outer membrane scaffolding protein for murein synthesis (MipA/OmpV family)